MHLVLQLTKQCTVWQDALDITMPEHATLSN